MPMISTVGRRSPALRAVILGLYLLLTAGAVTVVYPLALMLSTSVTSMVDVDEYRVVPKYLYDDDVLFAKFLEEKYVRPATLNQAYGSDLFEFRELPALAREGRAAWARLPEGARQARIADWREFSATLPLAYRNVCFLGPQGM